MKRFLEHFSADEPPTGHASADELKQIENYGSGITELLITYGGCSFRRGLYRLHTPQSALKWTQITTEAFPRYTSRIFCFGYDWLGRQFALDRLRMEDGQAQVLLIDLAFNEALEIPASFEVFHETELIDFTADVVSEPFFQEWLASGGASPATDQCVGYKVPPTLGGTDTIENLELNDMEVYWGVIGQITARIKKD